MKTRTAGILLVSLIAAAFGFDNIYREVEELEPVAPWELRTDRSGYYGTGYFYNTAGDVFGSRNATGILEFNFEVDEAAYYGICLRVQRAQIDKCEGESNDQCNDIWAAVDDESFEKCMTKFSWGQWGWSTKYKHVPGRQSMGSNLGVKYYLEPGSHTFRIANRSKGMMLDALSIYKEGTQMIKSQQSADIDAKRSRKAFGLIQGSTQEAGIYSLRGQRLGNISKGVVGPGAGTNSIIILIKDGTAATEILKAK